MGASTDGPRDFKMEYSVDGVHYSALNQYGSETASLSKADTIQMIFQKNVRNLPRTFNKKSIKEKGMDFVWDLKLYDDVYFKITPASDYRADGSRGLFGSGQGEWAIRSVELLVDTQEAADKDSDPALQEFAAYKTGKKEITLKPEIRIIATKNPSGIREKPDFS